MRKLENNGKRCVDGSNLAHPTSDREKSRFLAALEMTKGETRKREKSESQKEVKRENAQMRKLEGSESWKIMESAALTDRTSHI